jgi:tetratricopeptide (TPR) repeat protein
VLNDLAVLRMEKGQLDEAEGLFRRALAIREALPKAERQDGEALHDAAAFAGNLAEIDRRREDFAAAEDGFRESIALMRQAIARRPDYQDYRNDLYNSRWNLANTFIHAGRHEDAAAEVASTSDEFSERLQAHVEGVWLLMQCMAAVERHSEFEGSTNRKFVAERYRDQAREIHARIPMATYAPPAMQLELAWLLATCPLRELRDGRRAVELVRRLSADGFQSDRLEHTLCAAYLETGDFENGYQAIQRSLRSSAGRSAYQLILLSLAQAGRGEWDDARRSYARAVAAQQKLDPRTQLNVEHFSLESLFADAKSKLESNPNASAQPSTGNK